MTFVVKAPQSDRYVVRIAFIHTTADDPVFGDSRSAYVFPDTWEQYFTSHFPELLRIPVPEPAKGSRQAVCWQCHAHLDSNTNQACPLCGWLICHIPHCKSCGCSYQSVRGPS